MEIRLDGKVILVTGGTQGLGEAIARACADSAAAGIAITGRDPARGAAVAAALEARGVPTLFVAGDLADPDAPAAIVAATRARFGRIDGLVNAAGVTTEAGLIGGTAAQWDAIMAINARAPFFLMQHAVAAMLETGRGGAIVNIASVQAHCGTPALAIYSASKAALITLTRNAANAHLRARIRVNAIAMGWTDTPAEHDKQARLLGKGEAWRDAAAAALPFGRLGRPEETAALAVWLLADLSGVTTGATIDAEQWVVGAPPT
jgi:NAD(P)-dependent dehydrogenase (short-subunit alcohol dehydrogenase family)